MGFAQQTDLSVVVIDSPDPALPGSIVSFEVELANAGPDDALNDASNYPVIDIYLPMGAPVDFREWLQMDDAAQDLVRTAFLVNYDANIWDDVESGIFFGDTRNNYCQGLSLQVAPLVLAAGDSGKVYYETMVPELGVAGFGYTRSSGGTVFPSFGSGACGSSDPDLDVYPGCYSSVLLPPDNVPIGIPCMGTRLTLIDANDAPVTIVDDGTVKGSEGCGNLVDFPVGNLALIDRGTCAFQIKVENARDAGAVGAIIVNSVGGGSNGGGDDAIMAMACNTPGTCTEAFIPIPVVMVSYNTGLDLNAALTEGEVIGFMGIRQEEPNYAVTEAMVWEVGTTTDTNPDNDRYIEATYFAVIFIDGFESGDVSAW